MKLPGLSPRLFWQPCAVWTGGLLCCFSLSAAEPGRPEPVHSLSALEQAVSRARPGDVVLLAPGSYGEMCVLAARGSAARPVVVRPQTPDSVELRSRVTVSGAFLTLEGFSFSGMGTVVIKGRGCRLSRCHMDNVEAPKWVQVSAESRGIEIDHCLFENKEMNPKLMKGGQTLQVQVRNRQERHHLHHNHFRNIPKGGGGNGFETVQLLTRGNPFDPPEGHAEMLIESNLFERCRGEAEIISVKSNGNVLRGNTFRGCSGALVLRHGDANVVSGNYFFGDGEKGSGGVRLQGTDQVVVNNFFHGLGRGAVAMMDGTPDKLYVRVERARILHNTVVDCAYGLEVGVNHSKHPNGTVPRTCVIANNIFSMEAAGLDAADGPYQAVQLVQGDQPEEWTWSDNMVHGNPGLPPRSGLRIGNPHLRMLSNGLAVPTGSTPVGKRVPGGLKELETDIFGVSREERSTLGAAVFPLNGPIIGPLTEKSVGPRASGSLRATE